MPGDDTMKIVHVIPALTKGGGERVAVELANHAVLRGHQVTMVAHHPVDKDLLQNSLDPAIRVHFVTARDESRLISSFLWIRRNWSWLKNQDILHCHLTYGAVFGTMVQIFRKFSSGRKPLVVETYHAVGMAIPKWHRWIHARLAAMREGLALMAEDEYWLRFRKKHPSVNTKIILNGVSTNPGSLSAETRNDYRRKLGVPENVKYVVGTIGMLRPDRQPTRYIPIFADIVEALGTDVHFVIAGDGPEMEKVKSLVSQYHLEGQVHFAGLVLNPELPFSQMDLYVSLSVRHAVGVSMFEAALNNLPVVGIQVVDNYREGEKDWVWSSPDNSEVAQKIVFLLQNNGARKELAARQNKYVLENHSIEGMANAYYQLYNEVVHEQKESKAFTIKHEVK